MDLKLLSLLKKKRQNAFNNPNSILKKYYLFLDEQGIYYSLNRDLFKKSIKGHFELCDEILTLYNEAKLENERLVLIEDLIAIGYDENKLVELILDVFGSDSLPTNLWAYAELLYSLNNFRYLSNYFAIIRNNRYGEARQMLILLVGKSKDPDAIPTLVELLNDSTVYGHALDALSNYRGTQISEIMRRYIDCDTIWVRDIAKNYLHSKR